MSSAVDEQNPEVQEARRLQIPVIPRGELLAELMRLKYGIAVAGSHGKTTTTSMTATILNYAGLDPTVVVGGRVGTMGGSNARVGHSDFLVVESDESDGSFLKLAPIIAVVTNIDREHLDHYPSLDAIRAAFIEFVNKVPFYGAAIVCLDDPNVQSILPAIQRRTITYGTTAQADMEASEIGCGPFVERLPAALPHAGSGPLPPADSRPAQRAERHGRGGRGAWNWRSSPTPSAKRWPLSAAWTAAFRCAARSAASPWWTTTATIPPRSAPRSTARGCAASGASTCCSSRTATPGRST